MRDPVVYGKLHHLWIDHDQADILRFCLVQDTHDQRVDADGFTGACCAGDQQMWHFSDVCDHGLSCNIFSDCEGNVGWMLFERLRLQQIPQHDRGIGGVGNFDSHCRFSRDRGLNTDVRRSQVQFDVVRQTDDLADLDALFRQKLVSGDSRTAAHIGDGHVYSEVPERLFQLVSSLPQMSVGVSGDFAVPFLQKGQGRKFIYTFFRRGIAADFLPDAGDAVRDLPGGRFWIQMLSPAGRSRDIFRFLCRGGFRGICRFLFRCPVNGQFRQHHLVCFFLFFQVKVKESPFLF